MSDNSTGSDKTLFNVAWHRFSIITSVVSDATARIVSVLFYFTLLVPFGIVSRLFSDALDTNGSAQWLDREPVPNDIDSAKLQG